MISADKTAIIVGVTGHRNISSADEDLVALINQAFVVWFRSRYANRRMLLLTALAEGADRLVARIARDAFNADIVAVLPLPEVHYIRDFAAATSRRQFKALLTSAAQVYRAPLLAPTGPDPNSAQYAWAGGFIARRCDVLIAIWDGEPARGHGGTAEVVQWFLTQTTPDHLQLDRAPAVHRAGVPRCLIHINPVDHTYRYVDADLMPDRGAR